MSTPFEIAKKEANLWHTTCCASVELNITLLIPDYAFCRLWQSQPIPLATNLLDR